MTAITRDLELTLDDGEHLRLAGLEMPHEGDWPDLVQRLLAGWLTGRIVLVRALAADPDRWNRMPSLVFADPPGVAATGGDGRVSVTEALLEAGMARVRLDDGAASCRRIVLDLEARARTAQRGLWADPRFGIIAADDTERLAASAGRTVLVEGRILDVAESPGRTYLRLTNAGRRGFAIAIERRVAARLKTSGIDMAAWRGQPVRVRGLLDDRFGPQIELTSADQIEFTGNR